jgi:putative protein kinase ArgK-like GTPase of G3E family
LEANATLSDRVAAGDARAIPRALSQVEDQRPDAAALNGRIYQRTGKA